MELVAIPQHLPCLVLHGQVLLPTSFARISFATSHKRSSALLEHLSSTASKDVFVAVAVAPETTSSKEDAQDDDSPARALTQEQVGCVATAARVLQLVRVVQTGDWVLLLEGVCRVMIDQVMLSEDPNEEYDCVTVTQLEMRPPNAPLPSKPSSSPAQPDSGVVSAVPGSATPAGAGGAAGGGPDPVVQELGKQLKTTTRALLRQLTRHVGSAQSTRRMLELLGAVPAWRAADVVAAALGTAFQERLAVLRAVDHRVRVRLALSLAQSTLEAVRAGGPLGGPVGGAGPSGAWSGRPALRSGRGTATSSLDDHARDGVSGADDDPDGLDAVMARLSAARPPLDVAKAAAKEYKRLRHSGENQPGYAAARAYLETLADLPWSRSSADMAAARQAAAGAPATAAAPASGGSGGSAGGTEPHSSTAHGTNGEGGEGVCGPQAPGAPLRLRAARLVLDRQHYGLEKVKDRVIEYLAVLRLKGSTAKAPILCFIGPPGVGKTSLARSVAEVLGRPFVRIALGGVRDEAEVRGHRRTYVGAMPGRVVAGLRRAGVNDPVMLLDELDKLGKDAVRGDPSAALLEVLDPEQNSHFTDAYLGLPCDLSQVTFVATANRAQDIPAPLLDRLEVITLSGYTLEEKVHIAQCHLLPKTLADHGLSASHVHLPDTVMEFIADRYTREAGVRALSRNLAALCRHLAVSIVSQHEANQAQDAASPSLLLPSHPSSFVTSSGSSVPQHPLPIPHSALASASAASAIPPISALTSVNTATTGSQQTHAALEWLAGSAPTSNPNQTPTPLSLADLSEAPLDSFLPGSLFATPAAFAAAWNHEAHHHHQHHHQHQHQQPPGAAASSATAMHAPPAAAAGQASRPSATSTGGAAKGGWLFPWHRPSVSMDTRQAGGARRGANEAGGGQTHVHCETLTYPIDLMQQHGVITVTEQLVEAVLGPPRFSGRAEAAEAVVLPGAVAGLVWTAVGGSVQYIECARISYGTPGRQGSLTLTGQVGEVLEESARIALSWIRANAFELGLNAPATTTSTSSALLPLFEDGVEEAEEGEAVRHRARHANKPAAGHASTRLTGCDSHMQVPSQAADVCQLSRFHTAAHMTANATDSVTDTVTDQTHVVAPTRMLPTMALAVRPTALPHQGHGVSAALSWDIHVHLPAGAIPKDGPSAGITLAVALVSLLTGRVVRADTAMTGELTLRGLVLPVGGIKEKLLAARHAGLRRVIVPARNMRDVLADVPPAARAALIIIPAERLEQVLAAAFDPPVVLQSPPSIPSKL